MLRERPAWVVLLLMVVGLVMASAGPVAAQDRVTLIRESLAASGVYVEPTPALGEPGVWTTRLRTAVAQTDLGFPVYVALWDDFGRWSPRVPSSYDSDAPTVARRLGVNPGVLLVPDQAEGVASLAVGLSPEQSERVQILDQQLDYILGRLSAEGRSLAAVAQAWAWLGLADDDLAPRDLLNRLDDDLSVFTQDLGYLPPADYSQRDAAIGDPRTYFTAAAIPALVLVWWCVQGWRARRSRPRPQPLAPDSLASRLTDVAVEERVTDLSRAIARSLKSGKSAPGQAAYDRAQACLDAAQAYVDLPLDRHRVGCHVLAEEGLRAIRGGEARTLCYFHPDHHATTSVSRRGESLPVCKKCAAALRAGVDPPALVVADDEGQLAAFYEVDDVWTQTGYGALDPGLPRRALLARMGGES